MIKIIGCGNILRKDDGIGVYVIEELKKITISNDVELIDAGTRCLDIFSFLEGAQKIIIVDAVKNGKRPGTIYHMDIDREKINTDRLNFISTHDFNWQNALSVGREIFKDRFPEKITFFGIEVENIDVGLGLSEAVKQSLPRVINFISVELNKVSIK